MKTINCDHNTDDPVDARYSIAGNIGGNQSFGSGGKRAVVSVALLFSNRVYNNYYYLPLLCGCYDYRG